MDYNPPDSLSMGFARQEYWSGLPFPCPGVLPDPGIKPGSPAGGLLFLKNERCGHLFTPGGSDGRPAVWETEVRSLGWADPLEKEMATHSSNLAWKIPWTEEPGGLQSLGSQRVRHD